MTDNVMIKVIDIVDQCCNWVNITNLYNPLTHVSDLDLTSFGPS